MIITKLEEAAKGKINIYIDEEYQFFLYWKEVKLYHLKENDIISDETFNDIMTNTVLKRAKQKALNILKVMDRTEQELINKLKQAQYTDSIIPIAVQYVKDYHYIDDSRYAANFIKNKMNNKSRRQIEFELIQKGITKDIIVEAFSQEYNDEDKAIKNAILKKNADISTMSREEKIKLSAFLYRKGFKMDKIKRYVNDCNLDDFE